MSKFTRYIHLKFQNKWQVRILKFFHLTPKHVTVRVFPGSGRPPKYYLCPIGRQIGCKGKSIDLYYNRDKFLFTLYKFKG